jgi:hypothetical protein
MKIPADELYPAMRQLIASSDLTYAGLSKRSGVPARFIQRFKLGQIDELSTSHSLALCRALGIRFSFSVKNQ